MDRTGSARVVEPAQVPWRAAGFFVVLGLALVVRAHWWLSLGPQIFPDSGTYAEPAERLLRTGSFGLMSERTPAYPLLLAACGWIAPGRMFEAVVAIQSLMGVFVVGVCYWLSLQLCGRVVPSALCGLAYAILPMYAWMDAAVLSEASAAFGVALAVLFLIRAGERRSWGLAAASGVALGVATLTRPAFQFLWLPLAMVLGLAWYRRTGRAGRTAVRVLVAFVVPALVLPTLWACRNLATSGFFGLSLRGPYSLANRVTYVIEAAPPRFHDITTVWLRHRTAEMNVENNFGITSVLRARREIIASGAMNEIELSRRMSRLVAYLVVHRPMSYLRECGRAFAQYVLPEPAGFPRIVRNDVDPFICAAFHFAGLALFCVGLLLWMTARFIVARLGEHRLPWTVADTTLAVVLAVHLYNACVSCAAEYGTSRYHSPVDFLFVGAIPFCAMLCLRFRETATRVWSLAVGKAAVPGGGTG